MSKVINKDIIYFSRFLNDPSGNGGDRRTAQICQVLSSLNYTFVCMYDSPYMVPPDEKMLLPEGTSLLHKIIKKAFKHHITYHKYNKWSDRYRDNVLNFHFQSKLFINAIKDHKPKLLLIDDPVFLAPIVHYAKLKEIPLVAFCHNLETLSREQVVYKYQNCMFNYEMELLSMCRLVVTISREETFILKNFGLNPVFYPYFPVCDTALRFQRVREKRQSSQKANFLILGTVGNLPTLDGIKRLLLTISQSDYIAVQDDRIIVAGYGTNGLVDYVQDPRIQVRGQLSDCELDEVLAEIKGCIVYQENGSGALTKIPELLIAGVPVISNAHAARSYYNLPGVFEFTSLEGLFDCLKAAAHGDPIPCAIPEPATILLRDRIAQLSLSGQHPLSE